MKLPLRPAIAGLCIFMLTLCPSRSQVPEAPPPAPARELATLEAAYDREKQTKAVAPAEQALQRLKESYRVTLETALKQNMAQGLLDQTLALQNEIKRLAAENTVPEFEEQTTPAEVLKYRKLWRAEAARIAQQKAAAERAVEEARLTQLRQLEKELTRASKFDEALAVRARTETVTAQLPATPLAVAPVPPVVSPSTPRPLVRATPRQVWNSSMAKTAWQEWIGKTVRIRSNKDRPEYVQITSTAAKVAPLDPPNADTALFVVSKGDEPESICFELASMRGNFLRHAGFKLKFSKGTSKDSSFRIAKPKRGDEGISFTATNFPNHNLYVNERDEIGLSDKIKETRTAVFFLEVAPK